MFNSYQLEQATYFQKEVAVTVHLFFKEVFT